MAALIHYRCAAAQHQRPTASDLRSPTSPVTYHNGNWAYCPLGFHDGHEWKAIQPATLDEVKQALKSEAPASESLT